MNFVDTHTHLYFSDYQSDRLETIQRALSSGVVKLLQPNIDLESVTPMLELCKDFPENCYPMIGLHPTYVREDYRTQLDTLYNHFQKSSDYIAIGEVGIDLYRDSTYLKEQQEAFSIQIDWARESALPLVIHSRQSFDQIIEILNNKNFSQKFKGVFHSFSGTIEQANTVIDLGFLIGINGIVTFKNSNLGELIKEIPLRYLLLETDSPFLAPVPYRGKRNESSYIPLIAQKIAEIKILGLDEVAATTTETANNLFNLV